MSEREPSVARAATLPNDPKRASLIRKLADALGHDEAVRAKLIDALTKHRKAVSHRRALSDAALHGASLPATLVREAMRPSPLDAHSDSLADIWRQVGGYLSESIGEVRSREIGE